MKVHVYFKVDHRYEERTMIFHPKFGIIILENDALFGQTRKVPGLRIHFCEWLSVFTEAFQFAIVRSSNLYSACSETW
jgi:hypothetical protein